MTSWRRDSPNIRQRNDRYIMSFSHL